MTRENIAPCPACGESIDAVDVICERGRCPECRSGLEDLFAAASGESRDPTPEDVSKHYEMEVDG